MKNLIDHVCPTCVLPMKEIKHNNWKCKWCKREFFIMEIEMNELTGKGELPNKCPKCKKAAHWIWQQNEAFDDIMVAKASCSKCDTDFGEVMTTTSWYEEEKEDAN